MVIGRSRGCFFFCFFLRGSLRSLLSVELGIDQSSASAPSFLSLGIFFPSFLTFSDSRFNRKANKY